MRKILLATFAGVALAASQVAAQNLVENPSFEDPTVDMGSANDVWFRFASGAGVSAESTAMPRTGSRHMSLITDGANQFAGVFQNLNQAVNPGDIVTFSGWHKNAGSGPYNATSEIKLEWQGAAQNRVDVLTLGSAYEQFTHQGVAPAGTTGLVVTYAISSFGPGQNGLANVFLDDITVTLVPEPATLSLIGLGSLGLIAFARRRHA